MHTILTNDFPVIANRLRDRLIEAPIVDVGEWQSQLGGAESETVELEDVTFHFDLPATALDLARLTQPNLPWADEHFAERVSGIAWNPPPSAAHWPFKREGHAEHLSLGLFSHTYPERLWPNQVNDVRAPSTFDGERHRGLRYGYGDLDDVVQLLINRPYTRQAYIPLWFPEDTGAHHGQRVPCTLGYHLMLRNDQLKIVYYMRSCDYLRHFRDDVYLAGRLCQWVCEQLNLGGFRHTTPGVLVMHISSLHVFKADVNTLVYRRKMGKV
jgi:hypothetical protein